MACPIAGCRNPSYALYTWGLYPNGEHSKKVPLCKKCADELWEAAKPGVQLMLMHFVIEPLPEQPDLRAAIGDDKTYEQVLAEVYAKLYQEQEIALVTPDSFH